MFWLFRVYVALMISGGSEIPFTTPGIEMEIAVIFITLISIFMIFRRNLIFASIYLGTYFAFFTYGIALMNGNISTNTQLLNAMLMIPLRSANIPAKATINSGMVKINVF